MARYFGKTTNIDWSDIVESCKSNSHGDHNTVTSVVDRSEAGADGPLLDSYREIISTWKNAGYNLDQIEWWDYYPGEHFDIEVQNKIEKLLNAHPKRVFISEVYPGRNVPYHWDVEDKEEEWLKEGKLKRWVIFIDKPQFGHIMILENECFHNVEQGSVFEWDHYKSYHAGTNCGTEPYYLFHFLGVAK